MNFRLKCENPGKIEFTLVATMTADEWEQVREALSGNQCQWPQIKLVGAINDLLAQARRIYWPADTSSEGQS